MIEQYLEGAKRHSSITSDRALAKAIGIAAPSLHQYKTGRALPSDAIMLHLAELAGIPATTALIDLAFMRSNSQTARDILVNIKKQLVTAVTVVIVFLSLTNISSAAPITVSHSNSCMNALYIMENKI